MCPTNSIGTIVSISLRQDRHVCYEPAAASLGQLEVAQYVPVVARYAQMVAYDSVSYSADGRQHVDGLDHLQADDVEHTKLVAALIVGDVEKPEALPAHVELLYRFAQRGAALTSPVKQVELSDDFSSLMVNNFEGVESSVDDEVLHSFGLLEYDATLVIAFYVLVLLQPEHLLVPNRVVHDDFSVLADAPDVGLAQVDRANPGVGLDQRDGLVPRQTEEDQVARLQNYYQDVIILQEHVVYEILPKMQVHFHILKSLVRVML